MAFHDTINTGTTPNDGQGDGLRTNLRKLHDNTKDNKQRLDDLNGNAPGVVNSNGVTVLRPLDGTASFSSTLTGSIKISLPQGWSDSMLSGEVDFYNYADNQSFKLLFSGYLALGGFWHKTSVLILSAGTPINYPVRFGFSNNKTCLYIGDLNNSWSFLKTAVSKLVVAQANNQASKWLTGWSISLETSSFQNITKTHTNNLPVAQ